MVSFVYFDVGGVIVLDFSGNDKWAKLKNELGITPEKDAEFEKFFYVYERKVCAGFDIENIVPTIKEKFGSKLPTDYSLLLDGFVKRFDANKSIWPVLDVARKRYRIGLLTNMYPNMLESLNKRGLMPKIGWDCIIDSSAEGVQKPDMHIFELAEMRARVKGDEILFVENNEKNISAAKDLGWKTFLYDPTRCDESNNKLTKILRGGGV